MESGEQKTQLHPVDHDLLIRLDENVRNFIIEARGAQVDNSRRLGLLETSKLDQKEFEGYKTERNGVLKDLRDEVRRTDEDFDARITKLEGVVKYGLGALATIQIIWPIILPQIINLFSK